MSESITRALPTIDHVVGQARANLDGASWDYLVGGAESETTLRRNRAAFDRLAFRPRILTGETGRDLRTTYLGTELSLPVVLAPVGSIERYCAAGAVAQARVAEAVGTLCYVSSIADPGLEAARAASAAPAILQVYVEGDRGWLGERLAWAEEQGCAAICVTEFPTIARRERLPLSFWGEDDASFSAAEVDASLYHQAALTWDDVAWIASRTSLPVVVKGVMTGSDAGLAVEHGAAAVHVSNHGGRQLDHMQSTIEVLAEVVAAVDGQAEVVLDSGIVRGSDVVKAVALGARAVAIGKLMCWGLAAAGEPGLIHVLNILRAEIDGVMAHLGARTPADLTPECLVAVPPAPPSDWIGFAGRDA